MFPHRQMTASGFPVCRKDLDLTQQTSGAQLSADMKTALTLDSTHRPVLSRMPGMFKMLAIGCIALVTSALAIPNAHAAGPDGIYKLKSITGKFTANGQPVNIPAGILESALLQNGQIAIEDSEAPIYGARWSSVFNQFNSFGFNGKVKVTGPKDFTLKKSGKNYVGKTSKPVALSLKGNFNGQPLNLAMKINYQAKVSKNTLTLTLPVNVTAMGLVNVKGTIVMKATK